MTEPVFVALEPVAPASDLLAAPAADALAPDGADVAATAVDCSAIGSTEPRSEVYEQFTGFLRDLTGRIDALETALNQSVALQQHQATMIQKLHAENQALRQGELAQALKPFILDIARLHDDVERVIANAGDELKRAASIPEFILDVLDRHGVTQINPVRCEPFDSKLHQGVKAAATTDAALDGTVESVIRAGFVQDGAHLVRPAQVVVHRYSEAVSEASIVPANVNGDGPSSAPDALVLPPHGVAAEPQASSAPSGPVIKSTEQAGSEDVG